MVKKTKQSRKELLREDDAFIQAANSGVDWFVKNRAIVIGAVVAIGLLVLSGLVVSRALNKSAARDSDALAEAQIVSRAELVAEEDAKPDGDPPTFASEDQRRTAAISAFAPLRDGTGPGLLASFYHASLVQRSGDAVAAGLEFDALLKTLSPDHGLYFLAVQRAAYAHEAQGDLDGALNIWGRIVGKDAFYADRAAFHRARLTAALDDKAQAAELFAKFESTFPESGWVEIANSRLALLREEGFSPVISGTAATTDQPATAAADEADSE